MHADTAHDFRCFGFISGKKAEQNYDVQCEIESRDPRHPQM